MKKQMSLKRRLILPIALLGIVALISNVLAVVNIQNVNSNAADIADNFMDGKGRLAKISQSAMNIHKLVLSHIVATDYNTMIAVVNEIKEEEALLDGMLAEYESYVTKEDQAEYQNLLSGYESFKHALVNLVCASAAHKTQDAYILANGDVASYAEAMENSMEALDLSISARTEQARGRLSMVYISSLVISVLSIAACTVLVFGTISLILKYVVVPIKNILNTIRDSSDRIDDMTGEVRERTGTSKESIFNLSNLVEKISGTIREVASNAAVITENAEAVKQDTSNTAEECAAITAYTVAMKARADELEKSAQTSAEVTSAKAAEILQDLNEAIRQSQSVDQVNALTGEILKISQSTRLIALNATVEAANAGAAGKGFAVVASEIRELSNSSSSAANRIQEINDLVTEAVHNLARNAQNLVDYMNSSILTEFQEFVQSGKQYQEDAAYIQQSMDNFKERTDHLRGSMAGIAESIEAITRVINEGASGISGVAESTRSLVVDMEDITQRMGVNQAIVGELKQETVVFNNL